MTYAAAGWGDHRDDDLALFRSLDGPTRRLILRHLGMYGPTTDDDHRALANHPQGRLLAEWLLSLPAYVNAPDDDEDDDNKT